MTSFAPARGFRDATLLKDGLLGAAIGWHLTRRRIRFHHAHSERGTETDFIAILPDGHLLIECKMLGLSTGAKQLARTLREAAKQLHDHAAVLQAEGWNIRSSACVVNLTDRNVSSLRGNGFLPAAAAEHLISYEEFRNWLRNETIR
jgi:hypothetical protein